MLSNFFSLILLASSLSAVAAQTWTACNPLNSTDCPLDQALGMNYTWDFTTQNTDGAVWNQTAGKLMYDNSGALFTINGKGDSPTIQSQFYIFFGAVEVIMKAAPGQGVISSIVLESDDLDEVDWEFMGGNTTHAETNYFGKGNTTDYTRAIYYPVNNVMDFHNYTLIWTSDKLEWYIDGTLVRTLPYHAANGGLNYPQTPMTVRLGIWAGGDPGNGKGTIEWAGGPIDYGKGPYTMAVKSLRVQDYAGGNSPPDPASSAGLAKTYQFGDRSGTFQSIKIAKGNSTVAQALVSPGSTSQSAITQGWNNLPNAARIGIIAAGAVVGFLILGMLTFCCYKQRKAGRNERAVEDSNFQRSTQEQMAYREEMANAPAGRNVNMAMPLVAPSSAYDNRSMHSLQSTGAPGSAHGNTPPPMPALYRQDSNHSVGSNQAWNQARAGPMSPGPESHLLRQNSAGMQQQWGGGVTSPSSMRSPYSPPPQYSSGMSGYAQPVPQRGQPFGGSQYGAPQQGGYTGGYGGPQQGRGMPMGGSQYGHGY